MDPWLRFSFLLLAVLFLSLVAAGCWLIGSAVWAFINFLFDGRPKTAAGRWWQLLVQAFHTAKTRARSER